MQIKKQKHNFVVQHVLECDEIGKSILLEGLGDALERQDQWEEAIKTWREAIDLNLEQENIAGVARLYREIFSCLWTFITKFGNFVSKDSSG